MPDIQLSRKELYLNHLKSDLWQFQRKQAFERWGRFCGCCGDKNAIHVHHLNYRNLVDCVPEDFMPLCEFCHGKVHGDEELHRMAMGPGEPMEKRRMVILRLKQDRRTVTIVKEIQPAPLTKGQRRQAAKMAAYAVREESKRLAAISLSQSQQANRINRQKLENERAARREEKRVRREAHQKKRDGMTNVRPHTFEEVEAQMPPFLPDTDDVILTMELINRCMVNGSFTRETVDQLGTTTFNNPGWRDRLIGKRISRTHYRAAIEGKYIYAKKRFSVTDAIGSPA